MSEDHPDTARAGPLARWSSRKRLASSSAAAKAATQGEAATPAVGEEPVVGTAAGRAAEKPAPPLLPDVDQLGPNGDFTPFLAKDVPEILHRQALRALWRSDPLFAYRDGLTDYDEDYTKIGIVACAVQSAYRAGSGYAADQPPATPEIKTGTAATADLKEPQEQAPQPSGNATAADDVATDGSAENPSPAIGQDS